MPAVLIFLTDTVKVKEKVCKHRDGAAGPKGATNVMGTGECIKQVDMSKLKREFNHIPRKIPK